MPTIHPDEIVDDEAEFMPRWSGSNPGQGSSFIYPAAAGPDRRHAASRRSGQQAAPGLTPKQWLAQWCCLNEDK